MKIILRKTNGDIFQGENLTSHDNRLYLDSFLIGKYEDVNKIKEYIWNQIIPQLKYVQDSEPQCTNPIPGIIPTYHGHTEFIQRNYVFYDLPEEII